MSTELATFQKPADLLAFLQRGKGAVAMALPKHLNPDRMLRLALTAFSTNPQLKNCTGQSILASLVVASQLGLEPGVAGQGYLIPYKNTCTFVPGWQGLVGLLNNSGRATAWTGAVCEGDEWEFQLGSHPKCRHIPGPNFGDPDRMTWVYACGQVNGSEMPVIEAWPMARVWAHRDRFNKVGEKHYSFRHPEMYARKVVLLQVLKYMPRSIELNNAMTAASAADAGNTTRAEEGVIIEVPMETTQIQEGTVGKKRSPLAGAKGDGEAAPGGDTATVDTAQAPQAEKPQSGGGPDPEALRKELFNLGAKANIGRAVLADRLAELKYIDEGVKITDLSVSDLAALVDSWPEILDRITNPEAVQ